ncbi:outer membrane beta-barrel protein [Algoriphagus chordae]|uniref:Outer membrane protein with beta-barrel domain n=1 Tax=Algoriphagus chordae TaxID=237019 RepID=A0A2W7R377_9BACT|nr:outer membrane beta-barrel protein [Algoriphagus chordae]PZX48539.1 outer membrane protein with beta-barrel domain [Algoriphagus chordae]
MKRKLIFFSVLVLCMGTATTAKSQVLLSLIFGDKLNNEDNLFGIHMDYSWNQLSGVEADKNMRTFNFGLFYTHKWDNNLHLNIEMLAKYQRGAAGIPAYDLDDPRLNSIYADTDVTRKISYLSLPVTMRYAYKGAYFVELGPQASFRTKARDIFETELTQGDASLDVDIRDQVQRIEMGYVTGIGMYIDKERFNALGLRFQGGFSDVMKDIDGKQKNSQIAIYANLPIGRGKMKTK